MNIYVPGKGPLGAKILFVGEAPSFEEEDALEPFVGSSGREFDKLLRDAGISRGDCWITNVCKYMVPPNAYKKKVPFQVRAKSVGIDVQQQITELRKEIYAINPNIIVCLGGTALWALTGKESTNQGTGTVSGERKRENSGITDWRGSLLLGFGKKLISTYHPANLLHQDGDVKGYWNRQVMVFDLRRAKAQSSFPDLILPSRNLYVARDSNQFQDFINRHKAYRWPAIDIEAHPNGSGIPICVGIAFTKWEGITIPLWNTDDICSLPESEMTQLWIMLYKFLYQEIVGQNFKYDQDKIRRLGFVTRKLASDTMLKSFAINPELPKNLAFNTSIYTEEPFYKHEGMYEGAIKDLLIGCARDAAVTKEIDEAMDSDIDSLNMRDYYENFIMGLHDLYLDIESVGFKIDTQRQEELLRKYIRWDEQLNYERFALVGKEVNPGSPKQVGELLYGELKCPKREGTGEEVLTALLGTGKLKDEARRFIINVLDARRVRKTISTYLMALPDYDGRMKTTYFPCLETGRSKTGQLEPPIRPIVVVNEDGKKKKKPIGMAFQTITKHGDIGQDIRSMFIPD